MKNDFQNTLSEIIISLNPDRIIFEPSGIFIPDEILNILKMPAFSGKCTVNSLISIVDSINYLKQTSKYGYFFERQIQPASLLVLSKTQLVEKSEVDSIAAKLKSINGTVPILVKNWDSLSLEDMKQIMNGNAGDLSVRKTSDKHFNIQEANHGFQSCAIKPTQVFSKQSLENTLKILQNSEYGEVIRGKGFVKSTKGFLEFSYVNSLYNITKIDKTSCAMVCIIGRNLNTKGISRLFQPA